MKFKLNKTFEIKSPRFVHSWNMYMVFCATIAFWFGTSLHVFRSESPSDTGTFQSSHRRLWETVQASPWQRLVAGSNPEQGGFWKNDTNPRFGQTVCNGSNSKRYQGIQPIQPKSGTASVWWDNKHPGKPAWWFGTQGFCSGLWPIWRQTCFLVP